jgi:hypothetical protein
MENQSFQDELPSLDALKEILEKSKEKIQHLPKLPQSIQTPQLRKAASERSQARAKIFIKTDCDHRYN